MENEKKQNITILPNQIESLSDYIKVFEEDLIAKYDDEKVRLYFRGEKEAYEEPCLPSLFRKKKNDYNGLSEDEIYYRTLRRKPEEFIGLSNLDVLAKMQHYGIPTRLLDITTNPLIALFFATQKSGSKDGYVYVFEANHDENKNILSHDSDRALLISTLPKLNDNKKADILNYCKDYPNQLIYPSVLSEKPEDKSPIIGNPELRNSLGKFIYECERERHAFHKNHRVNPKDLTRIYFAKPKFSNERLKSQDGLFILFGLGVDEYNNKILGIKIPGEHKKKIMAELFFFAGLTNSKVFHGLESLSDDRKDELYGELVKGMRKRTYYYKGQIKEYEPSDASDSTVRYLIKTDGLKPLICLGLNPSYANQEFSDSTITRVEGYASRNRYDSIAMINLYPLRETYPNKLPNAKDPTIFEMNLNIIKKLLGGLKEKKVLLAMGEDVKKRTFFKEALNEIVNYGNQIGVEWMCSGQTENGYPMHPSRGEYRELVMFDPSFLLK